MSESTLIAGATPGWMVVRLGDLNVSSQKGAEAALRRIKQAARSFCGPSSPEVARHFAAKACEKRMVAQAVTELDAPAVTALNSRSQPIRLAQTGTLAR